MIGQAAAAQRLAVYVTPAAIEFSEGQVPQPFLLYNPFDFPFHFRVQTSNKERYLIANRAGTLQPTSVTSIELRLRPGVEIDSPGKDRLRIVTWSQGDGGETLASGSRIVDVFPKPAPSQGAPPEPLAPAALGHAPPPAWPPEGDRAGPKRAAAAQGAAAPSDAARANLCWRVVRSALAPLLLIPILLGMMVLGFVRPAHQDVLSVDKGIFAAFLVGASTTVLQLLVLSGMTS